jgi:DNA-binding transcriptional MerR regulator
VPSVFEVNGKYYCEASIAAQMTGVTVQTLTNWRKQDNAPPYSEENKGYPISELGDWIRTSQIYKRGRGTTYPWLPSIEKITSVTGKAATPAQPTMPGLEPNFPPQKVLETERDAKLRKTVAEADKLEMDIAERAGQLVQYSEVMHAWSSIIVRVKTALLSIPTKVSPLVSGLSDNGECEAVISEHVRECLEELSEDWTSEGTLENDEDDT